MPQLAISAAKVVVIGLLAAYGLAVLLEALATWTLADMDAYWNAAVRLRHGEALFPLVANEWAPDTYRYAPWFAVAWIPLTYLPKALVEVCWGSLLVASVGASIWPLARRRSMASVALAVLLGAHLLAIASGGNVHPLVVAALVHGVNRRSAPLWIALAASLKAFPAVYLLVFAVRGEWRKAIGGVAVFAALVLPLALVDLKAYPSSVPRGSAIFEIGILVWLGTFAVAAIISVLTARGRSRWTWPAASLAVILGSPRLFFYDLTYLLVGLNAVEGDPRDRRST